MYAVQSLAKMKKLEQVNGCVAMILDKLPTICGDLVRTDPEWQSVMDFRAARRHSKNVDKEKPC